MRVRDWESFQKRCDMFCNGENCASHAVKHARFVKCLNDMIVNRVWPVREILFLMKKGSFERNTQVVEMSMESLNELLDYVKYLKKMAEQPFIEEETCEARYMENIGAVVCGVKDKEWSAATDILSLEDINNIQRKGFCSFCKSFKEASMQVNARPEAETGINGAREAV